LNGVFVDVVEGIRSYDPVPMLTHAKSVFFLKLAAENNEG
jgi:hypothetical protein